MPGRIVIETCPAPECNLTVADIEQFLPELTSYLELFAGGFVHQAQVAWSAVYLHGLLGEAVRKNVEQIALTLGVNVRSLQHFIGQSPSSPSTTTASSGLLRLPMAQARRTIAERETEMSTTKKFLGLTTIAILPILFALVVTVMIAGSTDASNADTQTSNGTSIAGVILTNTTWTKAMSPISLTGIVEVSPGITLTVEPGVIIEGNAHSIQTWGNLYAVGVEAEKISFNATRILPGNNDDTDPPFYITLAYVNFVGGSIYPPTGHAIYGGLSLTDSVIRDTEDFAYIWYPIRDCYIERNIFQNARGLNVGISAPNKVSIRNNVFSEVSGNFSLDAAVVNWALYGAPSLLTVEFNSFLNTNQLAVGLPPGYPAQMIAANNYWNTTVPAVIQSMIYDRNDTLTITNYIPFEPFLLEPHPDTPSTFFLTPTPTSTATPTPTSTGTATPTPTSTATPTPTSTATPTPTSTATPTPTSTATPMLLASTVYLPLVQE